MDNADEAANKDNHRTDMLHNHSRVSHQRPEIIRPHPRITLKVVKKRFRVGVVIRIYESIVSNSATPTPSLIQGPGLRPDIHDCLTQSNFFQAPFRFRRRPGPPNFFRSAAVDPIWALPSPFNDRRFSS